MSKYTIDIFSFFIYNYLKIGGGLLKKVIILVSVALILITVTLSFILFVNKNNSTDTEYVYDTNVIRITVPYKYLEVSENELEDYINFLLTQDGVYSADKYNEEVSMVISEDKLESFKKDCIYNIESYIQNAISNPSFMISNISYNQDITEYLIMTSSSDLTNELEDISINLIKKSGLYQALSSKDPENTEVIINFLNTPNNTIIDRISSLSLNYTDMLNEDHDH